jgi:glycosyltransferase involved in cell wall biosynthesis
VKRWITSFELKRTEHFEGWLAALFDRILVTSQKDKNALSALRNGKVNVPEISILPNGVDLEYFRSDDQARRESETLVISGKMSYHANVSMVLFFVNQVMPRLWETHPEVKLWIVGKDPPPEITTLAQNPAVTVTGTVESIQPYLQSATIAVAPVQYGAGMQNKVIEAMASSTPVIATSLASAAFSVTSGEELLIADTPDEWVMAILSLLKAPEKRKQIGEKGRKYVERNHSWQDIVTELIKIYKEATAPSK